MSDDGVDGLSKCRHVWRTPTPTSLQIEREIGLKGRKVKVSFLFLDLTAGVASPDQRVVFSGLSNPPDEISESTVRLTFVSRLSLQRTLLPEVRIQRRCPWVFPSNAGAAGWRVFTAEQREIFGVFSLRIFPRCERRRRNVGRFDAL